MGKPVKKEITRTIYVLPCSDCGKECEVTNEDTFHITCHDCTETKKKRYAYENLRHLLAASIVEIIPRDYDKIESVTVQATNGERFMLTAGGWDERYIEVDEVKG